MMLRREHDPPRATSDLEIPSGRGPGRLEVRVLNRPHLLAAFGESVAEEVQRTVADRIRWAVSPYRSVSGAGLDAADAASVEIAGDGLYRVDLVGAVLLSSFELLVEDLSRTLALEAITVGDDRIHIAPSVRIDVEFEPSGQGGGKPFNPVACDIPFAGEPVLNDSGWADRYRSDMSVAARLLGEVRADELTFAFQPIRLFSRRDSLLYEECLLRAPHEAGIPRRLGLDIMALERLGLVRILDCHVMGCAIELLRLGPARRLGVNVSAQSACLDGWWSAVEARLAADRELAERLTIEITETSSFPSIAAAVAFVARMRALGCRVALDDFGVGRDAIRNLYALRPDVVKIDAFFLRAARHSAQDQAALKALVSFSRAIGGVVVVEGVESKRDSDVAVQAGAPWQQGYFVDPPQRIGEGPEAEAAVDEIRPAFGCRRPPILPSVEGASEATLAFVGNAVPVRPNFDLANLRWATPIGILLWILIAWAGWGGVP